MSTTRTSDRSLTAMSTFTGGAEILEHQPQTPTAPATENPLTPFRLLNLRSSPRCGAKTRSGTPCQGPKVKGRPKCRLHGCGQGSGAPRGDANGAFKHGAWTEEAMETRRKLSQAMRAFRTSKIDVTGT
jgi:hypothetical protein